MPDALFVLLRSLPTISFFVLAPGSYLAMTPSPTPSATPSPIIQTASNVTIANALALQFYQNVPTVNLVPKGTRLSA
jgi:hypothetical protein